MLKSGHLIHGAKPGAEQGDVGVAPQLHGLALQIDQYRIGVGVIGIEIFVEDNQIIGVITHLFQGVAIVVDLSDMVFQNFQAGSDFFAYRLVRFAHQGGLALFLDKIEGFIRGIVPVAALGFTEVKQIVERLFGRRLAPGRPAHRNFGLAARAFHHHGLAFRHLFLVEFEFSLATGTADFHGDAISPMTNTRRGACLDSVGHTALPYA